jgi:hypothetical protein
MVCITDVHMMIMRTFHFYVALIINTLLSCSVTSDYYLETCGLDFVSSDWLLGHGVLACNFLQ